MTTKLDPNKITRLLNQSTRKLDEATLIALRQARTRALQHQAVSSHALAFAGANHSSLMIPQRAQKWVVAGLLALVLGMGASMWWQHQREQQIIDTDVSILTDELPIELFID